MSKTRLGTLVRANARRESSKRRRALEEAAERVHESLVGTSGYIAAGAGLVSVVVYVEKRSQVRHIQAVLDAQRFPFQVEIEVHGKVVPVRT